MNRRLLLVDDDASIREIAQLSLEGIGDWWVVDVPSGQAAIEIAADGGHFDAVLLDMTTPGRDGLMMMRRLRAGLLRPSVPIVLLTAKLEAADRKRLYAQGAAGMIVKPFDPMGLPEELDRVLNG